MQMCAWKFVKFIRSRAVAHSPKTSVLFHKNKTFELSKSSIREMELKTIISVVVVAAAKTGLK
jgi:competence transcription factor ComK